MSAKFFRIFPEGDAVHPSSEHVPDSAANGAITGAITRAADGSARHRGTGRTAHRGNGRTTLASIAAAAGVSLPTVSKVVNGRPDVAAATRAKVERLLDEHHYARTGTRRGHRSGLIDLVFNGLDSPWAVEILRGVEEWGAAQETGVAVSAVRHGNVRPVSWTSALASHDTDGVILVTSELTHAQLEQLHSGGIPLVVFDPVNPPPSELASVGATNWAGGLAATEHLLALGHRRIAAIAGPGDYLCSRARIGGYR
jgi:LacI family transcriptional regulator